MENRYNYSLQQWYFPLSEIICKLNGAAKAKNENEVTIWHNRKLKAGLYQSAVGIVWEHPQYGWTILEEYIFAVRTAGWKWKVK